MLQCKALSFTRSEKLLFKDFDLTILPGSLVALTGPNGSGKSSFALGIMGHPQVQMTGAVLFNNQNILDLPAEKRARLGVFVSFQHPLELPGVSIRTFLREAQRSCGIEFTLQEFEQQLTKHLTMVGLPISYADRYYNVGFSGGERKRTELLSMLMLNPKLVILDEIDSGLDAHGIESLLRCLEYWRQKNTEGILIIISHYQELLNKVKIDHMVTLGS